MSSPQGINLQSFFPTESALQPEGLLHTRGIAGSGFRPLSNIPHCCLPQESGPCLSPSVADHPLRPATDHRLGEPLPHQQANRAQARPTARAFKKEARFPPWGLCGISSSFLELFPTVGLIPTCYAPVRHSSPGSKLPALPFDLHVLSMPPAFNLSHDQTLHFNAPRKEQIVYRAMTKTKRPHNLYGLSIIKEQNPLNVSRGKVSIYLLSKMSTNICSLLKSWSSNQMPWRLIPCGQPSQMYLREAELKPQGITQKTLHSTTSAAYYTEASLRDCQYP